MNSGYEDRKVGKMINGNMHSLQFIKIKDIGIGLIKDEALLGKL